MSEKSYNNWVTMTDGAIIEKIGAFISHHRLAQNRTQVEVARAAGMSRSTLSLLESGEKVTLSSLIKVLRVLDLLFIMDAFKVIKQVSPIAMAKLERQKRKRASKSASEAAIKADSEW